MAWKETCVMDERTEFIVAWKRGFLPMTALCEAHGISRKTGYKWRDRYLAFGWDGLVDVSRARHELGHTMGAEIGAAVIALRQKHPLLGPRKLKQVLERDCPDFAWPAASTIGDLLRREGLSEARRRRRRAVPVTQPFAEARLPNDLWCIDFKGWFRTRDGQRCDPLTVSDAVSRYVLACRIVAPTLAGVRPACEQLFRERGLPLRMRMDNGPPFASIGPAGLSQLSVWWLKLGIGLERIDPGAPQQNARHERMHGTLRAHRSTARRDPQRATGPLDEFIRFFSEFGRTRGSARRPRSAAIDSPRGRSPSASRSRGMTPSTPVRGSAHGEIEWGGDLVFVSEALAGEPIGIGAADGDWLLVLDVDLGVIPTDKKMRRGGRAAASGNENCHPVPGPVSPMFPVALHCSIVGTCLTASELRRFFVRFGDDGARTTSDHDLHSRGVVKRIAPRATAATARTKLSTSVKEARAPPLRERSIRQRSCSRCGGKRSNTAKSPGPIGRC